MLLFLTLSLKSMVPYLPCTALASNPFSFVDRHKVKLDYCLLTCLIGKNLSPTYDNNIVCTLFRESEPIFN